MGFPYNGLIPAAVLLDNPGITKEEFVELLDNCRTASIGSVSKKARWGSFCSRAEDKGLHSGLYGLAQILKLEGKRDSPEDLIVIPYRKGGKWKQRYEICIPKRFWGDLVEETIKTPLRYKVGDIYEPDYGCPGRIEEILEEDVYFPPDEERDTAEEVLVHEGTAVPYKYEQDIMVIQKVKIKETWIQSTVKRFRTIEDLASKFPHFHPEKLYDFSKEKGKLMVSAIFNSDFNWVQKNGKYYLDKSTFDKIPAGFSFGSGYTDLILTAEAIKHKAWKLLSYKGAIYIDQFLQKFPDSKKRYDQAVWDGHISLWAKSKGMSYSDLMRLRLFPKDISKK